MWGDRMGQDYTGNLRPKLVDQEVPVFYLVVNQHFAIETMAIGSSRKHPSKTMVIFQFVILNVYQVG